MQGLLTCEKSRTSAERADNNMWGFGNLFDGKRENLAKRYFSKGF